VVVTAVSDGCAGAGEGEECDTTLTVLRPQAGQLEEMAAIGLERVRYVSGYEPGVSGTTKVRLTTSPAYENDGIHLVETVSVSDAAGRDLRRAQLERSIPLRQGENPDKTSLWFRLFEKRVNADGQGAGSRAGVGDGGSSESGVEP
jgi:hypothetical protein